MLMFRATCTVWKKIDPFSYRAMILTGWLYQYRANIRWQLLPPRPGNFYGIILNLMWRKKMGSISRCIFLGGITHWGSKSAKKERSLQGLKISKSSWRRKYNKRRLSPPMQKWNWSNINPRLPNSRTNWLKPKQNLRITQPIHSSPHSMKEKRSSLKLK